MERGFKNRAKYVQISIAIAVLLLVTVILITYNTQLKKELYLTKYKLSATKDEISIAKDELSATKDELLAVKKEFSRVAAEKIIYEYKETLEGVQEVEIDNSSFLEEQIDTSDTENEITLSSRKEKYLSLITIDENCEIYDFTMSRGEDFQYAIYEIRSPEINAEIIYWEVVVLDNENVVTIIRQKKDENVSFIASTKEIILELDVNFDGKNDILVNLGGFGAEEGYGKTA